MKQCVLALTDFVQTHAKSKVEISEKFPYTPFLFGTILFFFYVG
jgi:hypothetical protein